MEQKPRRPELKPPPAKNKPKLVPPSTPRYISPDARLSGKKITLVLAFAIVTLGAIGVVVILPEQITRPPDAAGSRAPEPAGPTGGPQKAETIELQAQAKMEAETLLRTVLQELSCQVRKGRSRCNAEQVLKWNKSRAGRS